ncbi:NUDIX hydrolase N-terminal domain-containing protein [Paenibacillus qinlingensis]|uniref:HAD superfamily hydrolase (TIGR01509 family) n=1 Tax=Paenibacillus qinlingensis TaxID=1837343 RepID=A0ABU1NYU0_9BACL|nr:NUDIX hydrolase N-terminal domain-containing protein [Paenibacillus qinlingensis]MDR6552661.1 HAD superfamily hydrolase (TIGR01509 family) [Paenibacillus qinlingensis]
MAIKAVLFDFDGTLADTLPLSFYAFKHVFKKYDDRDVSTDELIAMFGPTEDDIIAGNLRNKETVQAAIADYYHMYENHHAEEVPMSNEMYQLLTYLKTIEVKMGIITGKSRKAYQISSESLKLSNFFDIVITGDDVEQPKPHPEGIITALDFLGVTRDEAVFVGDSNADIKAGKAAGLRTYGVQWLSTYQSSHFEMEPDGLFTSVDQFHKLIKNEHNVSHKWLDWAKQIQAIAQIGLTYSKDVFDLERFQALREISKDILDTYTMVGMDTINLSFANETGYATPKVDIRGVVFEDNKILLVKEKADGAWSLPGGWADIGYSPSEVAVKEIQEEAGFEVVPVKLLAVLDKKFHDHPPEPYHIYKMFILCRITGGKALGGVETSEVQFFGEHELPELSAERNTVAQVKSMFDYVRFPDKEVQLD